MDTITKQVRTDDQVYSGEVKALDKDLVDIIRIPAEVEDELNQLYNDNGTKDKKDQAFKQVLTRDLHSSNAVLAVAESRIHIYS